MLLLLLLLLLLRGSMLGWIELTWRVRAAAGTSRF
jgi:hypothetical protein